MRSFFSVSFADYFCVGGHTNLHDMTANNQSLFWCLILNRDMVWGFTVVQPRYKTKQKDIKFIIFCQFYYLVYVTVFYQLIT